MTDAVLRPDAPPPDGVDVPSDLDAAGMTVVDESARRVGVDLLRAALDDVDVVMLAAECHGLHSRPLTLLRVDAEGGMWFLVDAGEGWVQALVERPMVDVSADLHRDGTWISVSGIAVLSDDPRAIAELWTAPAAAFWESADDPSIRVLRVDPNELDVWRTPPTALGRALAVGRAIITGDTDEADVGTHEHHVINPLPGTEHAL